MPASREDRACLPPGRTEHLPPERTECLLPLRSECACRHGGQLMCACRRGGQSVPTAREDRTPAVLPATREERVLPPGRRKSCHQGGKSPATGEEKILPPGRRESCHQGGGKSPATGGEERVLLPGRRESCHRGGVSILWRGSSGGSVACLMGRELC